MDNVTHTLIGIAAAKLAGPAARHEEDKPGRRRLWIWSSIAANNFPDLDVLYTRITPAPLGSLLHHRGHTHTFIGLIPQFLILVLIAWLLRKRLGFAELERRDWIIGAILAALGLALHILADGMNSYGIHPFFPFWNGWVYGDAIFIIEPLLWIFLGGAIFWTSRNALRWLLPLIFIGGVVAGFRIGVVTPVHAGVLSLIAATFYFFLRTRRKIAIQAGVAASLALITLSFSLSLLIRSSLWDSPNEKETVFDFVLSPLPGNPLCWQAARVSRIDQLYRVQRGMASAWPSIYNPAECPNPGGANVDPAPVEERGGIKVVWWENYEMPLERFQRLETDCALRAWMRFTRIPFELDGQFADLRFRRRNSRNFTFWDSSGGGACPPNIPPWIPPRWDLVKSLGGAAWFD